MEIFAGYNYRLTNAQDGGSTWFHRFDLSRAHAAVEGELDAVRGRVLVEAVRSASEGALVGVAGDSLVLRVREAYGAVRPIAGLELAAGVLPTLTIPELDGTWMLRVIAPSAVEASGLLAPADLGARVRYELPEKYGWIGAAAYDGEGYTNRELNRGKNTEAAAEIHPLPAGALLPLGVFASYDAGSTGTASARADRVTGGLVWQGERVRGGAMMTYAWGVRDAGGQHASIVTAFVRVEPVDKLLLGARVDHFLVDAKATPADRVTTIYGAVGYRVLAPLEVFAALTRSVPTTRHDSEQPGSNFWEMRAVGRVVF